MKDPRLYIVHMLDCIEKIETYTNIDDAEAFFMRDIKTQDAVYRNFEIVGEAAKRVNDNVRKKSPSIPWRDISGFRDIFIHQYDGVDPKQVWLFIIDYLPDLKVELTRLLKELDGEFKG